MDFNVIGQIAVAAIGAVSAAGPLLAGRRAANRLRADLKVDLELLNLAPEGDLKKRLEIQASKTIDQIADEQERRRDPFGIGLGLAFIVAAVAAGIWSFRQGGGWLWLLVPVAFTFIVGLAGFAQDASRVKRDAKGKPLPKS